MMKRKGWCPCCNGEKSQYVKYIGGPKDGLIVLEHLGSITGRYFPTILYNQISFSFYKKSSECTMIYIDSEVSEFKVGN